MGSNNRERGNKAFADANEANLKEKNYNNHERTKCSGKMLNRSAFTLIENTNKANGEQKKYKRHDLTASSERKLNGTIQGIDYSGNNEAHFFPPGTVKVKVGWLLNRTSDISAETQIKDVSFEIVE